MKYAELKAKIEGRKTPSTWSKAVKEYALECLEYAESCGITDTTDAADIRLGVLVNHVGGDSIKIGMFQSKAAVEIITQSSEGGNYLIYNEDIAARCCSPSHFERMHRKDGSLKDPRRQSWLDMQTHCLIHAVWLIEGIAAGRRM